MQWNGPTSSSDYGSAVVTDNDGNVYITGASHYGNDSTFDIVLLKYDINGNLVWETSYNTSGGDDFPTAMTIDDQFNLYLTGASEVSGTDLDYITLKYDSSGQNLWSATYDYNNNTDIASAIVVSSNYYVTVLGGSEDSIGIWDYTTVQYDELGNEISVNREPATDADIRKPMDLVQDADNNFYITGISHNSMNTDVKVMKLDPTLKPIWVETFNAGFNEGGNTLILDESGSLFVGGWRSDLASGKQFLILKYDTSGSFIWEQSIIPGTNKPYSEVTEININSSGSIDIVGFSADQYTSDIIVAELDTNGNLIFEEVWNENGSGISYPVSIHDAGTSILITGRTYDGTAMKWVTMKYTSYERDTAIYRNTSGRPLFAKNELVVRFNPSVVKREAIDDEGGVDMEYGDLDYFLKPEAVNAIDSALAQFCTAQPTGGFSGSLGGGCSVKMLRIFKRMRTTDTINITRLGDTIPVPTFWSAFALNFQIDAELWEVANVLNELFPIILYVHPSPVAEPNSTSNDSLYPLQHSLQSSSYSSSHINIEPAWDIQPGGVPYVRVGIIDFGFFWAHEDLGYDGVNPSSSKIVDGWDFSYEKPIKSFNLNTWVDPHGTPIAGIIGAVRNNGKGVAGIAGSNNDTLPNTGVSMYGLEVTGDKIMISYYDAIVSSATDPRTVTDSTRKLYSYAVHLQNNSWNITKGIGNNFIDTNLTLIREAVQYAHKSGVTFIASAGNSNKDLEIVPSLPAALYDDWVLTVGSTGLDGTYKYKENGDTTGVDPSYWAAYNRGKILDIAAPAVSELILSTGTKDSLDVIRWSLPAYTPFNGSSAAVPHVAGAAALMMSYLNDSVPSSKNLAPEDIEYILQMTATDVGPSGHDSLTGFGRLNAGAALEAVKKPDRSLLHYRHFPGTANLQHLPMDTIYLAERFQTEDSIWYLPGKYYVKPIKYSFIHKHSIPTSDSIIAAWPRHSSSTFFPFYNSDKVFYPRENVVLESINHDSAILVGYSYSLTDSNGSWLGYVWPNHESIKPKYAFSVLVEHNATSGQRELEESNVEIKLYPNPSSRSQTLVLKKSVAAFVNIELYDISGRFIRLIYDGVLKQDEERFILNLEPLPAGIYYCKINLHNESHVVKVLKQ